MVIIELSVFLLQKHRKELINPVHDFSSRAVLLLWCRKALEEAYFMIQNTDFRFLNI